MTVFTRRRLLAAAAIGTALAGAVTVPAAAQQAGPPPAAASRTAPASPTPVFTLDRGKFTAFDIPFGEFGGDSVSVNDEGQIAGSYYDAPDATCLRGFLRDERGRFTRIDYPGQGTTQLLDINNRGQMVGNHRPSVSGGCSDDVPLQGFLREADGHYTAITIPGARQVQAVGINNRGQIAGDVVGEDGTERGYVRTGGRITTIGGPPGAVGASAFDINDNGQVVGIYADASGALHGFALSRGRYTTIDEPGAPFTFPFGINDRGQIAGLTTRSLPLGTASDAHGFVLRQGAGGPFTAVDVPGATLGTAAFHISDAGVVVGVYANPASAAGSPSHAGNEAVDVAGDGAGNEAG